MVQSKAAHPVPSPTPAELKILQYLWEHGPSTVREAFLGLFNPAETAYTTVLKQMQIMHEKGLVVRDSGARAHIFAPAFAREEVQLGMLKDFVSRVYQGSATNLVIQALGSSRPASAEEIEGIRRYLDDLESAGEGENEHS